MSKVNEPPQSVLCVQPVLGGSFTVYLDRREARADVFNYIESFHNPRQQRRMESKESWKSYLTKQSVRSG